MGSAKETVIQNFKGIIRGTNYMLQTIPPDKLEYQLDPKGTNLRNIAFHISTLPLGAVIFAKGVFERFPSIPNLMDEFENYL